MAPKKKASKKAPARSKRTKPKNPNMARPKHTHNLGGRVSLLTDEVCDKICSIVREGHYYDVAAASVGVCRTTLCRWMERGRREQQRLATRPHDEPRPSELVFLEFCEKLDSAEAEAERMALTEIKAHAFKDWRSVAWRLERRQNQRWGPRKAIEHSSPEDKPVRVQRIKIGDDEIEF